MMGHHFAANPTKATALRCLVSICPLRSVWLALARLAASTLRPAHLLRRPVELLESPVNVRHCIHACTFSFASIYHS